MHVILAALAGLAVGVFCPSIARKIHARLSAEASKASPFVSAEVAGAEATLKADAKKVL